VGSRFTGINSSISAGTARRCGRAVLYIIEAANLDAALAWASKVTDAIDTPIEVRPLMDVPNR